MALPTDLGVNDEGFLLHVVDYAHLVRWDGITWQWAPGDEGNGFICDFLVLPPIGLFTGYQFCDGTTTSMLRVGAPSLYASPITVPNESGGTYHKSAGTTDGSTQAASAPGVSGSTANESAHTHSVVVPSQNTGDTAPDTGDESAHTTVDGDLTGTTVDVAAKPHHHTVNTHHHSVGAQTVTSAAGSAHLHAKGTLAVDATAEPAHINVMRYFRR